jgi:hypothetical protein
MCLKDAKYGLFFMIILFQGIIILILFNRSIEIEGDIYTYLKIIGGDFYIDYDIESVSLVVFQGLGLFPRENHFLVLYLVVLLATIFESWIIFKYTNGSILWLLFFSFGIVPFFYAVNLRSGFGMFFLFLFFKHTWSLFVSSFFHVSYFPFLAGFKGRISFKSFVVILVIVVVLIISMFSLISGKLLTYYGHYSNDESVLGVLVELSLIAIFVFLMKKRYKIDSKILWYRVLFLVFFIAVISFRIAIISTRFITLVYMILLLVRLNSKKLEGDGLLTVVNLLFYVFFAVLILVRIYRVSTMFGFLTIQDGIIVF